MPWGGIPIIFRVKLFCERNGVRIFVGIHDLYFRNSDAQLKAKVKFNDTVPESHGLKIV
jgi:hypothetical protein